MEIETIARWAPMIAARKLVRATDDDTIADMIAAASIAAPPFGESERARWLLDRFEQIGLAEASIDEIGNVLARLPTSGTQGAGAPVILSAHLDTIFPPETPIDVRRIGRRIQAPGIADNCRGLAAMLTVARALAQHNIPLERPLAFVGTVGEEGTGDLRGVKHLFRPGSPWREASAYITLDGTGRRRIVNRGIGSRRIRLQLTGPGGHSWADFGVVNPAHVLGEVIAAINRVELPRQPRTTLTVGRIGGGTSVNAIPEAAWLELDLRSESPAVLAEVEAQVRAAITAAAETAGSQRRRGTPVLHTELRVIGDRPAGETPATAPLVRIARAVTRLFGETAELVSSSTDANAPMALGIPAIALGAGGQSGGTHTVEEWYSNEGGPEGIERVVLIVAAAATN